MSITSASKTTLLAPAFMASFAFPKKKVNIRPCCIHGIPVNLDESVYDNLRTGALNGYWYFNLENKGRYITKEFTWGVSGPMIFFPVNSEYKNGRNDKRRNTLYFHPTEN